MSPRRCCGVDPVDGGKKSGSWSPAVLGVLPGARERRASGVRSESPGEEVGNRSGDEAPASGGQCLGHACGADVLEEDSEGIRRRLRRLSPGLLEGNASGEDAWSPRLRRDPASEEDAFQSDMLRQRRTAADDGDRSASGATRRGRAPRKRACHEHHVTYTTRRTRRGARCVGVGRYGEARMAAAQAVAQEAPTRTHLTLKGSTALVHEFFSYSVQSILYQRSIYPSEDFRTVKKFGLQMLATTDDDLADYLGRAMGQLKKWLEQGKVRRLVVAIVEKESQETVERWQFDIEVVRPGTDEADGAAHGDAPADSGRGAPKTDAQVKAEMAAIIKQITASCTFLPMLEEPCAFQILAYTDRDVEVPVEWTESSARLIAEGQAEQVKLRSFSTHVHRVDAMVAYKREDDDV